MSSTLYPYYTANGTKRFSARPPLIVDLKDFIGNPTYLRNLVQSYIYDLGRKSSTEKKDQLMKGATELQKQYPSLFPPARVSFMADLPYKNDLNEMCRFFYQLINISVDSDYRFQLDECWMIQYQKIDFYHVEQHFYSLYLDMYELVLKDFEKLRQPDDVEANQARFSLHVVKCNCCPTINHEPAEFSTRLNSGGTPKCGELYVPLPEFAPSHSTSGSKPPAPSDGQNGSDSADLTISAITNVSPKEYEQSGSPTGADPPGTSNRAALTSTPTGLAPSRSTNGSKPPVLSKVPNGSHVTGMSFGAIPNVPPKEANQSGPSTRVDSSGTSNGAALTSTPTGLAPSRSTSGSNPYVLSDGPKLSHPTTPSVGAVPCVIPKDAVQSGPSTRVNSSGTSSGAVLSASPNGLASSGSTSGSNPSVPSDGPKPSHPTTPSVGAVPCVPPKDAVQSRSATQKAPSGTSSGAALSASPKETVQPRSSTRKALSGSSNGAALSASPKETVQSRSSTRKAPSATSNNAALSASPKETVQSRSSTRKAPSATSKGAALSASPMETVQSRSSTRKAPSATSKGAALSASPMEPERSVSLKRPFPGYVPSDGLSASGSTKRVTRSAAASSSSTTAKVPDQDVFVNVPAPVYHHPLIPPKQERTYKRYTCKSCNSSFAREKELDRHYRNEHFKCPVCDEKFTREAHVLRHVESKHTT